jgi:L-arabinose isomerase
LTDLAVQRLMAYGQGYSAESDQKTSVIAYIRDRFRVVANDVEVVEADHSLPNLPVARAASASRSQICAPAQRPD